MIYLPDTKCADGFSLIEIIIAIVIIGLAMGIMVPFVVSLRGSPSPVLTQQAVALGQEKLEQIIADRRNTAARGFAYASNSANYPAEGAIAGFPGFSRSVTIACVTATTLTGAGVAPTPSCTSTNFARVTVTVTHATVGDTVAVGLVTNY